MKITSEEWDKLDKFQRFARLKVKDEFLLKYLYLNDNDERILDYLFEKPYINNSGQAIDKLFVDDMLAGIVMYYFDKSVSFRDAYSFPLNLKIRVCLDIDNQLKTLHKYGLCFNDVHIDNFLCWRKWIFSRFWVCYFLWQRLFLGKILFNIWWKKKIWCF